MPQDSGRCRVLGRRQRAAAWWEDPLEAAPGCDRPGSRAWPVARNEGGWRERPASREPPFAWPDHPLALSGGEILATRILPLMGHNARDFARAAAVCRGWRAACRAASSTVRMYRETALQPIVGDNYTTLAWSPCGTFIASAVRRPPRFFIWRASTGALVNEWALATQAAAVPPEILENVGCISVTFSRDSTRVLTFIEESDHFAVWSVPDGQLLAVNRGGPNGNSYDRADWGVPGSASDGLIGFVSWEGAAVDLWDVSPPTDGGASRPRLRSRVDLPPGQNPSSVDTFEFSGDGSKFTAVHSGVVYFYDVASLTRLGVYNPPSEAWLQAAWVPGGQRVLVSWKLGACVWDFSRAEAPSLVTVNVGPQTDFNSWSPSGASYFVTRQSEGDAPNGPPTYALEERRAADGSLVRAVSVGPCGCPLNSFHYFMSPDSHALALHLRKCSTIRIVVFD